MSAARWERRLMGALIALMLGGLACGDPQAPIQRMLSEDFEQGCGGLPCAWDQIRGTPGQALWSATIHPGEHGLVLRGAGVIVRGPGGDARRAALQFGSLDARLAARCEPGNSLVLRVAIALVPPDGGGASAADSMEGRGTPSEDGTEPTIITLTALTALTPGSPFMSGGGQTFRITGLTLEKTGSGRCEIDEILIDDVGLLTPGSPAYVTPDPTC